MCCARYINYLFRSVVKYTCGLASRESKYNLRRWFATHETRRCVPDSKLKPITLCALSYYYVATKFIAPYQQRWFINFIVLLMLECISLFRHLLNNKTI